MNKQSFLPYVLVLIVFAVVSVLYGLWKSKDTFCACHGQGEAVHVNKERLHKSYESGDVTENSHMVRS